MNGRYVVLDRPFTIFSKEKDLLQLTDIPDSPWSLSFTDSWINSVDLWSTVDETMNP